MLLLSYCSFGQIKVVKDSIYEANAIEDHAHFPGGMQQLMHFIAKNFNMPKGDVSGKVLLSFVVETDGSLSNIKTLQGINPAVDAEAIRVMRSSPAWTPGTIEGVPVRSRYQFPLKLGTN